MSTVRKPYEHTRIVEFLKKRMEALAGIKSQREIANEVGYDKPNIVSMFKTGETKIPLDRIPALAKALDCDVGLLMRLGLEQYWPDKLDVINKVFGRVVTKNEWDMIQIVRDATGDSDPEFDEKQKADLRRISSRCR